MMIRHILPIESTAYTVDAETIPKDRSDHALSSARDRTGSEDTPLTPALRIVLVVSRSVTIFSYTSQS